MKRFFCLMLCVVLLMGCIAPCGYAAETATDPEITAQTGDVQVEAINGIGSLLSAEISEMQEESDSNRLSGYVITDLTVEGNSAIVTFDAAEDATLVVALYTEDGMRMITSASADVSSDMKESTVEFTGEMPEYFLARAYMLDIVDCSPLSEVYETPLYTQEMQELLDSTIDDYDADLVINFDDDPSTNFAVYNEGVVIVEEVVGVNVVTTNDDENLLYVIENANETFTNLQPDDIVSYFYGEDQLLLCKVETVIVEGSTVTIHGSDSLVIEEVFSHVKVDGDGDTSDFSSVDTDPNDGIYLLEESEISPAGSHFLNSGDHDVTISHVYTYKIDERELPTEDDSKITATVSGKISLGFNLKLSWYVSRNYNYLRVKLDYSVGLDVIAEGKITLPLENFCYLQLVNTAVFNFALAPTFKFTLSGKVDFSAKITGTIGFTKESGRDLINLNTTPKLEMQAEVKSTIEPSFDFQPVFVILHKKLASVILNVPLKAVAEMQLLDLNIYEDSVTGTYSESVHACNRCLEGKVYWSISVIFSVEIAKLKESLTIEPYRSKETKFYKSFTYDAGGIGTCPYKLYLVTFSAVEDVETDGNVITVPVEGATIQAADLTLTTDSDGLAYGYFGMGSHHVTVTVNHKSDSFILRVSGTGQKMILHLDEESMNFAEYVSDIVRDNGIPIASGSCGDSATWTLYPSGLLDISGSGKIKDYSVGYCMVGSYKSSATKLVISDQITEIGRSAFYGMDSLKEVTLGKGIQIIGERAFCESDGITTLVLPESVSTIKQYAFYCCRNLTSVTLPDSLAVMEAYAFSRTGLSSVDIPNTIRELCDGVFLQCEGLTEVNIPEGVEIIGNSVFSACSNLSKVTLPETVMSLGNSIFSECSKLTDINIPLRVTAISDYLFNECVLLTEIFIPANITSIGYGAFKECTSLITADIPYGVNRIGDMAFYECESLTTVHIPETASEIGNSAFEGCKSLHSVYLPNGVSRIGQYAFDTPHGLDSITFPDSLEYIGHKVFGDYPSPEVVIFEGDAPVICGDIFYRHEGTVYYPADNPTWIPEIFDACRGKMLWIPYNLDEEQNIIPIESEAFQADGSSNKCSFSVTWSLNDQGILVISGTGDIPNFISGVYVDFKQNSDQIKEVYIAPGITRIGTDAFKNCANVTKVTIPYGITHIYKDAFANCTSLVDVYYAGTSEEWALITVESGNTALTNANIHYGNLGDSSSGGQSADSFAPESCASSAELRGNENPATLDAVYGGEYDYEDMGDYIRRTASFSGLVPGAQYVMLAMVNIDTAEPVAPENLLFIDQALAGEDGTLQFTYVQRVTIDPSFVVLCGPATKTLADANITVPDYYTDGELHVVNPTVIYDGETLVEGRDYEISGQVCFQEAGTYTCYIRGIHNYTGTMQCVYTVGEWNCDEMGHDFDDGYCRYCGEEELVSDPTDPSGSSVIRLSGSNRYQTGFAVADQLKRNMGVERFDAVVVAYGQNFPDALTGSYLAAVKGAPILLTEPSADADLLEYLKDNLISGGTVYILGGTAAVSQAFEDGADSLGFAVNRLKGAGRYETNLAILREAGVNREDEVLIATGKNYADSLSASATGLPMLLVDKELTQAQKEFLATTSGKFVIIGGTGAVSGEVEAQLDAIGDVVRIKGANRYGTSVEIAKRYFTAPESVVLAYAQGFPDGLCGGPLALSMGAPLILTSNENAQMADAYVVGVSAGAVTGGTGRISDDTVRAIFDLPSDTPIVKP